MEPEPELPNFGGSGSRLFFWAAPAPDFFWAAPAPDLFISRLQLWAAKTTVSGSPALLFTVNLICKLNNSKTKPNNKYAQ